VVRVDLLNSDHVGADPSLGALTPSDEVVGTHVVASLETVSVKMSGKEVCALDSVETSPTGRSTDVPP
jgi:hypothetical protein